MLYYTAHLKYTHTKEEKKSKETDNQNCIEGTPTQTKIHTLSRKKKEVGKASFVEPTDKKHGTNRNICS